MGFKERSKYPRSLLQPSHRLLPRAYPSTTPTNAVCKYTSSFPHIHSRLQGLTSPVSSPHHSDAELTGAWPYRNSLLYLIPLQFTLNPSILNSRSHKNQTNADASIYFHSAVCKSASEHLFGCFQYILTFAYQRGTSDFQCMRMLNETTITWPSLSGNLIKILEGYRLGGITEA